MRTDRFRPLPATTLYSQDNGKMVYIICTCYWVPKENHNNLGLLQFALGRKPKFPEFYTLLKFFIFSIQLRVGVSPSYCYRFRISRTWLWKMPCNSSIIFKQIVVKRYIGWRNLEVTVRGIWGELRWEIFSISLLLSPVDDQNRELLCILFWLTYQILFLV